MAQNDTTKVQRDQSLVKFVSLGVGIDNILRPDAEYTLLIEAEVGIPWRLWLFYPVVGGFVTTKAASYLYGGINCPKPEKSLSSWF